MLAGAADVDGDDGAADGGLARRFDPLAGDLSGFRVVLEALLRRLVRWAKARVPFKRDLRKVHARFGSSVLAYFVFLRCGAALARDAVVVRDARAFRSRARRALELRRG